MRAIDIIAKKRDGLPLSTEEIDSFIQGFTRGEIPDYQAAAWLMAIVLKGMDKRETIDLTMSMARSGEMLDLSGAAPFVVDKHSTGGVGDKTTLVVAPLVAALGLPVGKMSGRGLGFSGGTLDKLESIPGFNVNLTKEQFLEQLTRYGIVLAAQSAELAPADGALYALRDVTATVESIPLIASSIMSKKIASGANAIVLDVKVGKGAFMKELKDAITLARTMVEIGEGLGRKMAAVISDMNQPLGNAVGNTLEVQEAIETLQGRGPADFLEHCLVIAAQMLLLAGGCVSKEEGRGTLLDALSSGRALDKLAQLVEAQGGDVGVIERPEIMPQAHLVETVPAPQSGYIAAIDAMEVGLTAMLLGAGRAKKGEPIDHAVGIVLKHKVNDYVEKGEPLLVIHADEEAKLEGAKERLLVAYTWSNNPVEPPPLIYQIITG